MHSANRARETVDLRQKNSRLFPSDGIQISHIWTQSITRSGLLCNIVSIRQKKICSVDERRVIDVVWPWTVHYQHGYWPVTTSVEDFERMHLFERMTIRTPCELTTLISSLSVTFSVTFVWLLPCYIFHSKVCLQHRQLGLQEFILQGTAAATQAPEPCGSHTDFGACGTASICPTRILWLQNKCEVP